MKEKTDLLLQNGLSKFLVKKMFLEVCVAETQR